MIWRTFLTATQAVETDGSNPHSADAIAGSPLKTSMLISGQKIIPAIL